MPPKKEIFVEDEVIEERVIVEERVVIEDPDDGIEVIEERETIIIEEKLVEEVDVEAAEKRPLLDPKDPKVVSSKKQEVDDIEKVGVIDPNFASALQMAIRTTVWMALIASIVWVPAIRQPFPNQIQARIPLVLCLFVFTVNPLLGTAVANGFAGIVGTFWACLHMWVMNGIFPGGMKEGMSPTSAVAIFGWVNFLVFTFIILFVKCGMGMKMFALATDIGFMLAFLDPMSTLTFSENFTLQSDGVAVNTLLATMIACLIAPILNLIPYPYTSAFINMKGNAVKASKDMGNLFEACILYYNEQEYSVVIESELQHSVLLRTELDGMGGAINSAWFERFDVGVAGTIRALMESHLGLMNSIYDRLRALLVAVSTEDFGESHIKLMSKIRKSSIVLAESVKKLLIAATEAATDGDISSAEKETLKGLIADVKKAVKQLAVDFDGARRAYKVISKDTFGECFFVLNISAYARLTIEYAETLISNPPQGVGFGAGISAGISSTFSGLGDRFNVNFTLKHYIALVICWIWAIYVDNFGGACVITAVFLMSTAVCPDIQVFLNVMNAVIVAVVVGTLVFQWSCGTGHGYIVLPLAAVFLWLLFLYGYFSGGPLLLPCLVIVALTPFRWVAMCPEGEIAAGARALWAGMVGNVMAIVFVAACQFLLAIDRASNLAISSLDDAFKGEKDAFHAFWAHKDTTVPMGPVAGHLSAGEGFNASARIEPRLWRTPWKDGLYSSVVVQMQQLRLDILMLWFALAGSDGKPDQIFAKFEHATEWKSVQSDLNSTLDDAHNLVIALLSHEGGRFNGLSMLKNTVGIDQLDALPGLIEDLSKGGLKFPGKVGDSMEDDEICQIGAAFLLLDTTIKHIAGLLSISIRQS